MIAISLKKILPFLMIKSKLVINLYRGGLIMGELELRKELEHEKQNFKELAIERYQLSRIMIITVDRIQKLEEELYGEIKTKWEDADI